MSDQEFYKIIKKGLDGVEPSYNPDHWIMMQEKLNPSFYQDLNNRLKNFSRPLVTLLASIAIIGTGALYIYLNKSIDNVKKLSSALVTNKNVEFDTENRLNSSKDLENVKSLEEESQNIISEEELTLGFEYVTDKVFDEILESSEYEELPLYLTLDKEPESVEIPLSYGRATFNSQFLPELDIENIEEIVLVYSKHPEEINFDKLNQRRLDYLYKFYPALKDKNIKIRFVSQTNATTKEKAEELFHGFVIHYKQSKDIYGLGSLEEGLVSDQILPLALSKIQFDPIANPLRSKIINEIKSYILNSNTWEDSTTYKALEVNKMNWKSSVVVFDWTSSMFMHGAQATRWIIDNKDNHKIKQFIFFNDCDPNGIPIKESELSGGMYEVSTDNVEKILTTMVDAAIKGVNNKDYDENDFEAVKFAVEQYPDVEEVILVADNKSAVRDKYLIENINKPIRVILCGITYTKDGATTTEKYLPIQNDYVKLVSKTGGSIHIIENDAIDLTKGIDGAMLNISGKVYQYRKGRWRKVRKSLWEKEEGTE